jgi:hypothetical protein
MRTGKETPPVVVLRPVLLLPETAVLRWRCSVRML